MRCSRPLRAKQSLLRWHTGQSGVTPDSPVNYSGAASHFPEGGKFSFEFPGAPDTVWWCTGHCPVAHRTVRCARPGQPSVGFAPFYLNPFLDFLLVCVEPLAPVKLIIQSKLVSPIICVGQFNHQNQLGNRCKPNSLSISPFLVIDANTNQSKYRSA